MRQHIGIAKILFRPQQDLGAALLLSKQILDVVRYFSHGNDKYRRNVFTTATARSGQTTRPTSIKKSITLAPGTIACRKRDFEDTRYSGLPRKCPQDLPRVCLPLSDQYGSRSDQLLRSAWLVASQPMRRQSGLGGDGENHTQAATF
jgi:hypothetical protein